MGVFNKRTYGFLEVVKESYVGKTPNLLKAEKALDVIMATIKKNDSANILSKEELNKNLIVISKMKEKKILEDCIKKEFKCHSCMIGFYSASLHGITHNVVTTPSVLNIVRKTKDGKTINNDISISFYENLASKLELTGGEALAIILHEIGHNIRIGPLRYTMDIMKMMYMPLIIPINELQLGRIGLVVVPEMITELVSKIPILYNINRFAQDVVFDVSRVCYYLSPIPNIDPINLAIPPVFILAYTDEKYADSITTSYGYGVEFMSAIDKLENKNTIIDKSPTPIAILYDINMVIKNMVLGILSVHPPNAIRVQAQMKNIKKHMDNPNITTEQRKELEKQYKEAEKFVNEYYLKIDSNDAKRQIFSKLYRKAVFSLNGFADIREILSLTNYEE